MSKGRAKTLDMDSIRYLYLERHLSGKAIAHMLGVAMETIYMRLRRMNVLRTLSEAHSGERAKGWRSGNWKGGRYLGGRGYVLVYSPGHPHPTQKGSYVYEHRLVMEEHLERYLSEGEVVHHINGNREDNRIENLKLFPNNAEHLKYEARQRHGELENVSEASAFI